MKKGFISEYFTGLACKTLAPGEVDSRISHQHEFNAVTKLKEILGEVTDGQPLKLKTRFLYLQDDVDEPISADGELTWYDARWNHPTRSEYRLYFRDSPVMNAAHRGDTFILGLLDRRSAVALVCKAGDTITRQVKWLFGLEDDESSKFVVRGTKQADRMQLKTSARLILRQIGIEMKEDTDFLPILMNRFPDGLPPTREFSAFARETLPDVDARDDPDEALLAWMEREELLFRTMEAVEVKSILNGFITTGLEGHTADKAVDAFLWQAKRIHNRRVSRAGASLENHLQAVFDHCDVQYASQIRTERKSKPDFIFPSAEAYHSVLFPAERLSMLGAKTTAKDRWRQILVEADRIDIKHLFTLQSGISIDQTTEMAAHHVIPVLPRDIIASYPDVQQRQMLTLQEFVTLVKKRQAM